MPRLLCTWLGLALFGGTCALAPVAVSASQATQLQKVAEVKFTHPIRLVTLGSPGGGSDIFLRQVAKASEPFFGVSMPIVYKGGTGGLGAWAYTVEQPADGTTIVQISTLPMITMHIVPPKYGLADLKPIINLMTDPMVLLVKKDAPWRSVEDLIAHMKANPGKMKFATGGTGSMDNIVPYALGKEAGFKYAGVAFEGAGESATALLGGVVDAYFGYLASAMPQIQAGTLRPLVTSNPTRIRKLPDVPTLKEKGYDVVFDQFRGLAAAKGVPDNVIKAMHDNFKKGLETEVFQSYIEKSGAVASYMGPEEYGTFLSKMDAKFKTIVNELGLAKK